MSGFLGMRLQKPKTIDKIKIRAKGRRGVGMTADDEGKKIIVSKLSDPIGKVGKTVVKHEDKRTQDLWLV